MKLIYLSHFSRPAGDRPVFKAMRKTKPRRIVECGIGTTLRSQRMIEAARLLSPNDEIHFTGIDLFESRSAADGPGVSLKLGHRLLRSSRARVQLIPGDPLSAFARAANSLAGTDILLISANCRRASMAAAWFFVPRMLHQASVVFEERRLVGGQHVLKLVGLDEVDRRAAQAGKKRAA